MHSSGKRFWRVALGLGFLAFANGLRADVIEHSGPILSDTVWRSADEHLIVGDVTVYSQVTLTIEAGTTVRVAAGSDSTASGSDAQRSELIVNGSLLVQGTSDQPALITSNAPTPKASDWGGIRFNSRFPFVLRHAVIEYGSVGVDYRVSGAVSASVTIEDSIIRHSGGNGVYLEAGSGATLAALVRNTTLHNHSGSGLALSNSGTLAATVTGNLVYATTGVSLSNSGIVSGTRLSGNEIRNNNGNGLYVYVAVNTATPLRLDLEDNNVHDNSGRGLYFYNYGYYSSSLTAVIRGNTVASNSSDGVYLSESNYTGRLLPQLSLNRIQGNGDWGIYANSTRGADIVHNQVSGNTDGGIRLNSLTAIARVNFNDLGGDNGTSGRYDLYNADTRAVDARANWWGATTTAEMAAGGNPKDIVV